MLSLLSLRELNYYITFSSLCQVLFENFLSEVFPFVLHRFRAAYILYHFLFRLSTLFFKISFRKFLLFQLTPLEQLYYYITFSTLCQYLFKKFFVIPFLSPPLSSSQALQCCPSSLTSLACPLVTTYLL